jgi:hypothetical protein
MALLPFSYKVHQLRYRNAASEPLIGTQDEYD